METYPTDANLLAQTTDPSVGFDHIPTGTTPYHLHFRRLVQRLGLAAARANDLRVYEDGPLSVGVYPGRCLIADQPHDIPAQSGIALTASVTTRLYLDSAATLQATTDSFPSDRSTHLRLAEVITDDQIITQITDLRGESLYQAPSPALLGLTATADEINQALSGIDPSVNAAFLNILTGGPSQTADSLHQHLTTTQSIDGRASIVMANLTGDPSATVSLQFSLPFLQPAPTLLELAPDHTHLQQNTPQATYPLVGSTHLHHTHPGPLTASSIGSLLGAVPISGTVVDVIVSIANNTQSTTTTDGIAATVYANGQALTSTPPSITAVDGSGFRCTDAGDGTPAQINATHANVNRGDLLTVDLTLTDTGPISQDPADVAVLVVLRPDTPE
ncbi:MAG: hypothetical protein AAGI68_00025 [Planctomycetota bacterium]